MHGRFSLGKRRSQERWQAERLRQPRGGRLFPQHFFVVAITVFLRILCPSSVGGIGAARRTRCTENEEPPSRAPTPGAFTPVSCPAEVAQGGPEVGRFVDWRKLVGWQGNRGNHPLKKEIPPPPYYKKTSESAIRQLMSIRCKFV